jgi:hypothetical protein
LAALLPPPPIIMFDSEIVLSKFTAPNGELRLIRRLINFSTVLHGDDSLHTVLLAEAVAFK